MSDILAHIIDLFHRSQAEKPPHCDLAIHVLSVPASDLEASRTTAKLHKHLHTLVQRAFHHHLPPADQQVQVSGDQLFVTIDLCANYVCQLIQRQDVDTTQEIVKRDTLLALLRSFLDYLKKMKGYFNKRDQKLYLQQVTSLLSEKLEKVDRLRAKHYVNNKAALLGTLTTAYEAEKEVGCQLQYMQTKLRATQKRTRLAISLVSLATSTWASCQPNVSALAAKMKLPQSRKQLPEKMACIIIILAALEQKTVDKLDADIIAVAGETVLNAVHEAWSANTHGSTISNFIADATSTVSALVFTESPVEAVRRKLAAYQAESYAGHVASAASKLIPSCLEDARETLLDDQRNLSKTVDHTMYAQARNAGICEALELEIEALKRGLDAIHAQSLTVWGRFLSLVSYDHMVINFHLQSAKDALDSGKVRSAQVALDNCAQHQYSRWNLIARGQNAKIRGQVATLYGKHYKQDARREHTETDDLRMQRNTLRDVAMRGRG